VTCDRWQGCFFTEPVRPDSGMAAATVLSRPHSAPRLEMPAHLAKRVRRLTITRIADTSHLRYSRRGRLFPDLETHLSDRLGVGVYVK
jgi:hypothetical protein